MVNSWVMKGEVASDGMRASKCVEEIWAMESRVPRELLGKICRIKVIDLLLVHELEASFS